MDTQKPLIPYSAQSLISARSLQLWAVSVSRRFQEAIAGQTVRILARLAAKGDVTLWAGRRNPDDFFS